MRVRLLPSSLGSTDESQYLTTYLINGTIAIDAGCIGIYGTPEDQRRVLHIFLTHCHADHIVSLPMFLENTCEDKGNGVTLYGHPDVLQVLSRDVFNDRIWPDYRRFESADRPFFRLVGLSSETAIQLPGLRILPVQVDHVVTTLGYIVEDEHSAVIFGADSRPTDRIWDVARRIGSLKAAFVEVSFPDEYQDLAIKSGHLTPALLKSEMAKLPDHTSVIATHIKPKYRDRVVKELKSLGLKHLEIGTSSREYAF